MDFYIHYDLLHNIVLFKSSKSCIIKIYDEYQDRLDDYLEDPEVEIEFDPDVFDLQDD